MKNFLKLIGGVLIVSCSSPENETDQTPIQPSTTEYTLTVNSGTGGTVSASGGTYEEGSTVNVTATPNSEYIFQNWSNGSTDNPLTVTVNQNITLTANFIKRKYPLTINIQGEGTVREEIVSTAKSTPTEYNSGTVVRLTADPNSGWLFQGWSEDSTENPIEINISSNISITAVFEETELNKKISKINSLRNMVTEVINPGDFVWSTSLDLDNDDDGDLVLTRSDYLGGNRFPTFIFRQTQSGFEKYDPGFSSWGIFPLVYDFNQDGLEDLFYGDHGYDAPPFPGAQDQILIQNNDGTLTDKTNDIYPQIRYFTYGATALTLNEKVSIICNVGSYQYLYRSNGGEFIDQSFLISPTLNQASCRHSCPFYPQYGHPPLEGVGLNFNLKYEAIRVSYSRTGDFNNDGLDDVIFSASSNNPSTGTYEENIEYTSRDPYGNIIGRGEIILFQNSNSGTLEYRYPESVIIDTWMDDNQKNVYTDGLLIHDFNEDGCLDYATIITDGELYVRVKLNDCEGGFVESQHILVDPNGEIFEHIILVDIDDDDDMDIVVSDTFYEYETSNVDSHKVLINENGLFTLRSGITSDVLNLPIHVALEWPID